MTVNFFFWSHYYKRKQDVAKEKQIQRQLKWISFSKMKRGKKKKKTNPATYRANNTWKATQSIHGTFFFFYQPLNNKI